jgi:DNA-directed RNA polymerase specialized sigma54-like protein
MGNASSGSGTSTDSDSDLASGARADQLHQAVAMLAADHHEMLAIIEDEVALRAPHLQWERPPEAPGHPQVVGTIDKAGAVQLRPVGRVRLRTQHEPTVDGEAPADWRAARWFVRAVEQRQRIVETLLELAARDARAYFAGTTAQMPKLLREGVAARFAMHEDTIASVIANKAVRCASGIIQLAQLIPPDPR